ncbi:uncharacterized protein KGF55_002159 [Candida pseudojiufengensis]|uniref:uncharacterized protein n=1 Tax=Candida pseudojiufengensis TaxID=497109 RepID=UPI0022240F47|nr:uncharacterized protein KGF55_002159 [Candida pseudojiufengensis]KAI5964217.1 hypothetical protein KGF55_002159 [Candida pseudojiufengensis]
MKLNDSKNPEFEDTRNIPLAMTQEQLDNMEHKILYRQIKSLKVGELERFKIHFKPHAEGDVIVLPPTLWVKVKNLEPVSKRAIYLGMYQYKNYYYIFYENSHTNLILAGPYILYVDCRSSDYDPNVKYFVTADQPVFEPQLLPGQSFYVQLSCHTLKKDYCWIVDVISQIIFNNKIMIDFEITVGTSKQVLHDAAQPDNKILNSDKYGTFHPLLNVGNWDTEDLWNLPVLQQNKPKHLVILCHGLHSNSSADMLYLKEQIDKSAKHFNENENEQVVVKSFFGNVGKTERGIKYLGSRVAEYIVKLVTENDSSNNSQFTKISFIGHSLGGCVQTFAIAYLTVNFPWFFEKIKPINFITISSPLLGVVNENPLYVKLVLSAGFVGKTGQELGLKYLENNSKPLLLLLPTGSTHKILKRFIRRTVYANAINDGIVPLRTSSLLYLDYKGLAPLLKADNNLENSDKTGKVPKSVEKENTFSPIQTFLSYFMPQKQKGDGEQYKNFQTTSNKPEEDDEENEGGDEKREIDGIPHSTFISSAASLILPPLPSIKYITDPTSRENVIIHDKLYYEKDLPKRNPTDLNGNENISLKKRLLGSIDYDDLEYVEEEIAREYHKNMGWRKVIVKLKPDAHNNIIVRRRFANAYGWPVIQHLVENHFSSNLLTKDLTTTTVKDQQPQMNSISSNDSLDEEIDLTKLISRDIIIQKNNEIDKSNTEEEENSINTQWINSKDNAESLFALGVTGLLGEVTGMFGDFRDQLYNYSINPPSLPLIGQIPIPSSLTSPDNNNNNNNNLKKLSNADEFGEGINGISKRNNSVTGNLVDDSGDLGLNNGVMSEFL